MSLTVSHEFTIHFALLKSSMGSELPRVMLHACPPFMGKFTAASFIDCKKNYSRVRREELKLSPSATINHTMKYLGK